MDTAAITERVDAIRAAVQAAQAHRCAYGATKATYQASMATVMDEDIGPLDDLAREIGELANAPKAPDPGPEEPPPAPWRMPNGFTAPTHWDGDATKLDWYPGPLGTGIAWPLGGTVTVERGPSPGGTPIEWANYWADNGKRYRMGHVLRDVRTGRVEAHRVFAAVGDTGIEMLPDAAHIHLEVYDTQGRALPVLAELHALGFRPALVDRVPSPDEYLAGKARAGRFV